MGKFSCVFYGVCGSSDGPPPLLPRRLRPAQRWLRASRLRRSAEKKSGKHIHNCQDGTPWIRLSTSFVVVGLMCGLLPQGHLFFVWRSVFFGLRFQKTRQVGTGTWLFFRQSLVTLVGAASVKHWKFPGNLMFRFPIGGGAALGPLIGTNKKSE